MDDRRIAQRTGAVSVERLYRRYEDARGKCQPFWAAYRKACEYAAPQINTFTDDWGTNKSKLAMTSQPILSVNAFVSEFISNLTPPNRRWMELAPTRHLVNGIILETNATPSRAKDIQDELDRAYREITQIFFENLDMSNFYAVLDQFVRSIGLGTGCMLVNELEFGPDFPHNKVPFEFIYVPVSSLSVDAGNNNKIYGVYRDMRVRREEILELWPSAAVDRLEVLNEYSLVECAVYDPETDPVLPWVRCVFDRRTKTKVLDDLRTAYNPFVLFRWSVIEGEAMGRGPILTAMSDIQSANQLMKVYYEWVQKKALGIVLAAASECPTPGMFNNDDFRVGGITIVQNPNNYVPLNLGGDMSMPQFLLAEFTQSIKQQLLDVELPTDNTMTAYEVRERANRILKLMAGIIGRINMEFVEPVVHICLRLLAKHQVIAVPPAIGTISQFSTKIVLTSPLARSQQLADIDSIRVALETIAMLGNSPSTAQYVNEGRTIRDIWVNAGASAELLNTPQERAAIQQAQMQQTIMEGQASNPQLLEARR